MRVSEKHVTGGGGNDAVRTQTTRKTGSTRTKQVCTAASGFTVAGALLGGFLWVACATPEPPPPEWDNKLPGAHLGYCTDNYDRLCANFFMNPEVADLVTDAQTGRTRREVEISFDIHIPDEEAFTRTFTAEIDEDGFAEKPVYVVYGQADCDLPGCGHTTTVHLVLPPESWDEVVDEDMSWVATDSLKVWYLVDVQEEDPGVSLEDFLDSIHDETDGDDDTYDGDDDDSSEE